MNRLYPLKFNPILKDKIWGGSRLNRVLNKPAAGESCGESWEISAVEGDISVVSEGFLKGNNLKELIEIYMGDLMGDSVYDKFGLDFPLLIKYIDANDDLSIQVHPDDIRAAERHNSFGKTEMWYVIEAEKNAKLISGFNRKIEKEEYITALENGKLKEVLNFEETAPGDVFFMPAGRVHAIGAGILLAEIQQTSDITYRIYDWERKDKDGNSRELHTELALDVIDFSSESEYKTHYKSEKNQTVNLVECKYFTTNLMHFDSRVEKEFSLIDSFVIYMCPEGKVKIQWDENKEMLLSKGETVLIPAEIKNLVLIPETDSRLLEIYLKDQ